jgi:hypothetical protein
VCGTIGIDGLFLYIGHVLVINLENIQEKIRREIKRKEQLVELVEYHGKIIDAVKVYRKIYFPILFAQFLLIVSQIGVLGYQFTTVRMLFSFQN